jgi:ubiquinone/menaquinone biosynthesis C-methylase UbiE
MSDRNVAFIGSIPQNYDRYLGPVYFHHYADDLSARLEITPGMRVLEVACGTGIVTERLVRRLAGRGTVVATDLNEPMLAYARQKAFAATPEWRQADGTKLPFDERSFDAVVCQFGLMFFPDKMAGLREAFRVLKPGGRYLFNSSSIAFPSASTTRPLCASGWVAPDSRTSSTRRLRRRASARRRPMWPAG